MPELPFRRLRPGGKPFTAAEMNALADAVDRLARARGLEALDVNGNVAFQDVAGRVPTLRDFRPQGLWAVVSGSASGDAYSGYEIYPTGGDATTQGALSFDSGTFPLRERNGATDVPQGQIVWAYPSPAGDCYFFLWTLSDSLTLTNLTVNNTLTVNDTFIDNGTFILSLNRVSTTGTYNNWNLQGKAKQAITPTAGTTITGFAGGTDGQLLIIWNVGNFPITLANQNAGSTAANRIITPLGVNYVIWPNGGEILEYDGTTQRWRFDSPTFGAGDPGGFPETYGCRGLKFRNGLTYTDGGDGTGTVDANYAVTEAHSVLTGFTTLGTGAYEDDGTNNRFTLASNGTYILWAAGHVHATITGTSSDTNLVRWFDGTGDGASTLATLAETTTGDLQTCFYCKGTFVVVAAPVTIKLQLKRSTNSTLYVLTATGDYGWLRIA